ncbi:MAG: hypothetical protein K2K17_01270, partial [Lachnospiraceae bacterium]|nr:hypothetical protein [Lachnospiraceae bacterium]
MASGNRQKEDTRQKDRPSATKRIMILRMRKFAAMIVAVAVIAVVILVCYTSYINYAYTGYEVISSVEKVQTNNSHILSFGTYFLSYSSDGIRCTDEKGNDIWSCPFEMQSPMIEINGDYVAVADYAGRTIYIFNSTGELGTIQTNLPIRDIEVAGNGVVAAVLDNGDVTSISLYYYDGSEIGFFRTTMSKSGYPLDIGMSADGTLVAVSYLYLDNGTLTSKVAFYNFGEVGQNKTDNLVGGYDYQNEMVPLVGFMNDSTAFAVANDKLMFYEGSQKPTNRKDIFLMEEIRSVYYGDKYIGLTYINPTAESRYLIDIYNTSGDLKNTLPIDMEYQEIFFNNDYVVIYNAASCIIYNINGNIKYQGDFEESVLLMIPTNSVLKYVLVLPDQIQTIV